MRTNLLAAAITISVMVPATAQASFKPYVPPGNSAANEYVESVPTASGNRSTRPITSHSSSASQSSALSPGTQTALARQGRDGARAAALVQATAPASARKHNRHSSTGGAAPNGSGGGGSGGGSGGGTASAPAATLLHALTGSGTSSGLGAALPALLIVAALTLSGIALWRRRAS